MASDIPNTESATVARMAIAWNIVQETLTREPVEGDDLNAVSETITQLYTGIYNALLDNEAANPHANIVRGASRQG